MMQFLFKSRWFAAIWVLMTLGSIATFVSEGGGNEKIQSAAAKIKAQNEAMAKQDTGQGFAEEPADSGTGSGFASDDQPADETNQTSDDGSETRIIHVDPNAAPPDDNNTAESNF